MTYDAAGNLLTKLTAELRKSISDKGYISYTYDFERLHEVLYPENLFNRVTYTYGKAGDKYNRAGRLALVEDASGGEAYYYGRQGEVTKTVRTVMASVADIRTYVYGATYDSWNRVQTMTYPDGEVVTYHYNAAGQVESMTSNKQGRQSVIVDRIGYDKEGHTVYTKLGNGTETTYTYDKQRERLQVMNLTADGQTVMENRYRYDAVDNILGITNAANPTSLTKLNKAKLGGRSSHTYEYDELNRLVHANGKAKRASYDMVMSFGRMSEPLTKVQKVDSTTTAKSYNFAYKYEDSNHPTAPTQIGHDHYTYDANGNPTLVTNDSANTTREMYWDEDNRLMVLSDNGKTSRYTYNAAGERIMKSYGTMEGVYINGAPQGITFHETDNFTLYPASILSVNKNRFTKHYFIGDKRVASRIGTGMFNNVYGRNGSYVTAGQQDYAERMNQIQRQKEAYYKQQGIAPGVPTMKGAYGDPENTKRGYNSIIDTLGNHDVPQGWIQTPRPNTTPNTNPGPPVSWNDPSNPDDPQAGYGYIPNDTTREETFFYHSDHLGSTSYITDDRGNITQYDAYLPYGELLVDEHSSSEDLPYKFNGKQFDEETGLYYYGARYLNPMASVWYGVDPLAEKYPTVGGYVYTLCNPVRFIDLKGKKPTTKEAALISKHVYGGSDAADTQRDLEKSGWKVSHMFDDLDLSSESGLKSQFYERTKNGKKEFCYAFAGTDFTSIGDDVTDVQQFFGGVPRQYSEAVSNAEVISNIIEEKYGKNVDLTFVGHSLGGGLAAVASMATGFEAMTFNPAAVVSPLLLGNASRITNYISKSNPFLIGFTFKQETYGYTLDGMYEYSIGGDILTMGQSVFGIKAPGKSVNVYTGWFAGHSIDNFYDYYYGEKK